MTEPEGGPSPTGHDSGRGADQVRLNDVELIERVRAAGPESVEAEDLATVLLEQGLGVLHALNRTNRLIPKAKERLRGGMPERPANWSSIADGTIYLAVTVAVKRFMKSLFDGGGSSWRPDGGASLRTYFVNGCLLSFSEVYRKDHAESGPTEIPCADVHGDECSDRDDPRIHRRANDDPESRAVDADTLRQLGPQLTDQQKQFVVARADGQTYEEIGRAHGTTGDAVSSSLRRLRNRIGC